MFYQAQLERWVRSNFRIKEDLAKIEKRKFFYGTHEKRKRFEGIGNAFVEGFNSAMRQNPSRSWSVSGISQDHDLFGYSVEGAAMALQLLDFFQPNGKRVKRFIDDFGSHHIFQIMCGLGWAYSKAKRTPKLAQTPNSLHDWLIYDGFGFQKAFFSRTLKLSCLIPPRQIPAAGRIAFYQGVGRAVWFHGCATPEVVASIASRFPIDFVPSIWEGIGLASCFAGGANYDELDLLLKFSGQFEENLRRGACAAGVAHSIKPKIVAPNAEAVLQLTGFPSEKIGELSVKALEALSKNPALVNYSRWRDETAKLAKAGGLL